MRAHVSAPPGAFLHHCVPGQRAPVSGLYRVHHLRPHRGDHNVVILRAEELPACRLCRAHVQYVIEREALYITDDFDFVAPVAVILPPKKPAVRAAF